LNYTKDAVIILLDLVSMAMLAIGVTVLYSGILFLRRPEDALDKSIHYDSSTTELTDFLRLLSTATGILLGLFGIAILLFAVLFVIQ
jgi:hypothetical protein